jgi:hypothetical protein
MKARVLLTKNKANNNRLFCLFVCYSSEAFKKKKLNSRCSNYVTAKASKRRCEGMTGHSHMCAKNLRLLLLDAMI